MNKNHQTSPDAPKTRKKRKREKDGEGDEPNVDRPAIGALKFRSDTRACS
jgi:hypothetical protein